MSVAEAKSFQPLSKFTYWLLHLLVFSAFLTEIKLVPALSNNVGLFEVVGGLLILSFLLSAQTERLEVSLVVRVLGVMFVLAAISQLQVQSQNRVYGIVQTAILLFLLLILLTIQNLGLRHNLNPGYILKLITYSILIVGPWILANAVQSESNIQLVGPFRNRSHMGTYMLTGFWLVLIYSFWPHRPKPRRPIVYAALALCLYTVAISGRRSVYLSLAFGLAILVTAFIIASRGKRLAVLWTAAFTIGTMGLLYQYSEDLPRMEFFKKRVHTIGDRLSLAVQPGGDEGPDTFYSLQRQGVRAAVADSPAIGIGWGGFPDSKYSATRHEVHSTPLRFLAETGIVGFLLYCFLVGCLMFGSLKMFLQMRDTAYGPSFQVLAIAFWSLPVSWIYNRHITERTFFLLLAVFLLMLNLARRHAPRPAPSRRRLPAAPSTSLPRPPLRRPGLGVR